MNVIRVMDVHTFFLIFMTSFSDCLIGKIQKHLPSFQTQADASLLTGSSGFYLRTSSYKGAFGPWHQTISLVWIVERELSLAILWVQQVPCTSNEPHGGEADGGIWGHTMVWGLPQYSAQPWFPPASGQVGTLLDAWLSSELFLFVLQDSSSLNTEN